MADDPLLQVAVVGAGALGTLFGGLLALTDGIEVTIVSRRREVATEIATHGVAPGIVEWTIPGPTALAPRPHLAGATQRFVDFAHSSKLPLRIAADRDAMLWEKLLAAAANSVCGALMLPVSTVLQTDAAWELLGQAHAEGFDVAAALGIRLDRRRLEPALAVRHPQAMKAATGSTYQSLVTGRDDEVDDIAGAICSLGRKAGVPTPVNDALHLLVQVRRQTGAVMPPS